MSERISKTAWLNDEYGFTNINALINALTNLTMTNSEPWQVWTRSIFHNLEFISILFICFYFKIVNYGIGGQSTPHYDTNDVSVNKLFFFKLKPNS